MKAKVETLKNHKRQNNLSLWVKKPSVWGSNCDMPLISNETLKEEIIAGQTDKLQDSSVVNLQHSIFVSCVDFAAFS